MIGIGRFPDCVLFLHWGFRWGTGGRKAVFSAKVCHFLPFCRGWHLWQRNCGDRVSGILVATGFMAVRDASSEEWL